MYVTVSVPGSPIGQPTAVTVYVQYIPADPTQSSVRVASALFTYVIFPVTFNWVAICGICDSAGSCLSLEAVASAVMAQILSFPRALSQSCVYPSREM